jgi:hypothetical protein
MWTALFSGTIPWLVAVTTLVLVLTAALLIVRQVRASDGEMTVRLRWLGLHVHRRAADPALQDRRPGIRRCHPL